MTAPLPKYRVRYAASRLHVTKAKWSRIVRDVSAAKAAAQCLERADNEEELPQTVYVQVQVDGGEVLDLVGKCGMAWSVTAPPSRSPQEWNQKGEQPL